LPSEQAVWEVNELLENVTCTEGVLVVTPSIADRVSATLPYRRETLASVPIGTPWLVVAGGGSLMDDAKRWRVTQSPGTRLAVIPTIWGSGAEVSPIAVTHGDAKEIAMSPALIPDVRVRWASLADGLPAPLARWASGDALTHAVEALLSPLGDDELRRGLAAVLNRMLDGPADAAEWFDASAEACRLQSRASVGLVHGIAHVLEPALWSAGRRDHAAHARICTAWLAPVMRFNLTASPKAAERLKRFGVSPDRLLATAERYGDREAALATSAEVRRLWSDIVRDRCTRTNVALIRLGDVDALLGTLA
jgi:alcohol dehydrogenase class IV